MRIRNKREEKRKSEEKMIDFYYICPECTKNKGEGEGEMQVSFVLLLWSF
jgi:hypothetical protein